MLYPISIQLCGILCAYYFLFTQHIVLGLWVNDPYNQSPPPSRTGHSIVTVENDQYIFGGMQIDGCCAVAVNTLIKIQNNLDSIGYDWSFIQSQYDSENETDTPSPRYYHAAVVVGPVGSNTTMLQNPTLLNGALMYIFGGQLYNSGLTDELWEYDFMSNEWTLLLPVNSSNVGPCARSQHSMVTNGTHLIVFGGWDGTITYNDVWLYNRYTSLWTELLPNDPSDAFSSEDIVPIPRFGHAAVMNVVLNPNFMFMFGGCDNYVNSDSQSSLLGDFWILDVSDAKWYSYLKRTNGGGEADSDDPLSSGSDFTPPARYGHTLTQIDGDLVFLFGGRGGGSGMYFSDTWLYKYQDENWFQLGAAPELVDPNNPNSGYLPIGRASHSAALIESGIIIFGGVTSIGQVAETMLYELSCDCQGKGQCYYGLCICEDGYSGPQCQFTDDTPLLLGLGLAVSVPILCFGWCILRCVSLPTRLRILVVSSLVLSASLGAGYVNCPSCWLPAMSLGVASGIIGIAGVWKCRQLRLLLAYSITTLVAFASHIYAIASFLDGEGGSLCTGYQVSEQSSIYWSCRYIMVMSFVNIALMILAVPLTLRLIKHRRNIMGIRYQGSGINADIPIELIRFFPSTLPTSSISVSVGESSAKEGKKRKDTSGALNFLRKEEFFREKVSEIFPARNGGDLQIVVSRTPQLLLTQSFDQIRSIPPDHLRLPLIIIFQSEEGVDLGGVRKEWFTLILRILFNPDYALFSYSAANDYTFKINPDSGVNPDHLDYFKFSGWVMGRALLEGHFMEQHLTRVLYKLLLGLPVTLEDMENSDPEYHKNLKWLLDNDISGPGGPAEDLFFSVEFMRNGAIQTADLKEGGRDLPVTQENKAEFVDLMCEWRLKRDCHDQFDKFAEGFHSVVPLDIIKPFLPLELEILMCGLTTIDLDDWMSHTQYRGYQATSNVILWFWEIVGEMTPESRASLLQFVTGTVKVPPGGFQALRSSQGPQLFTIQRVPTLPTATTFPLPVSHTCFNRLDLPSYPDKEKLAWGLKTALEEGLQSFSLA